MNTSGNGQTKKSPEQLEREIDEERAHLSHTLDVLEGKLSPGELFDKVIGYTKKNSGEFSRNLVDTVSHNPIPSLMTAIGITWMMYQQNQSSSNRASVSGDSGVKDKVSNVKERLGGKTEDMKHRASDKAHQASESMRQRTDHLKQSGREQAQKVSQGFNHMLEEQPLALGAIGVALGALLGASLPPTRQEDRMMGEARDRIAGKASQATEQKVEEAKLAGKQAKEDVKSDMKAENRPAL